MYRGTTPTLRFTLPFDTSTLDAVWVTIAPGGKIIINKKKSDCERTALLNDIPCSRF